MREFDFRIFNRPIDVSKDFARQENLFFNAARVVDFDPDDASGTIEWKRYSRKLRLSFNQLSMPLEETASWEFPPEYYQDYILPFKVSFITPRTIRLRIAARTGLPVDGGHDEESIMLSGKPGTDNSWKMLQCDDSVSYKGKYGSVTIKRHPFNIEIYDSKGRLITKTQNFRDTGCIENIDPVPFSFIRKASDFKRYIAASFTLSHDEKIFGCGESFTRLNKRGQKIVLCTSDAYGVQTKDMYKPVPFFISSHGYGMFMHSSAPMTFDLGNTYDQANTMFLGDDSIDLFIFLGEPREVLSEYTALTGRSPMPPLWSFGLWMSRLTYWSEEEITTVAENLRKHRIPCDVIHIDTGWFETEWRCDYEFSKSRFGDPVEMNTKFKENGLRISLWQLPYFMPLNKLYGEAIEKGYAVLDADGRLPAEDAVIDFSNEEAVKWYQGMLQGLLETGIGAIKVDFGEAAPYHGVYKSGKSGLYEHNLYPLRYNKAAFEVTKKVTGDSRIWARSAWAGSQRYPLHWGGDAENYDSAMAASLRGGLSLGLCGFSFWSHDIGGFVKKSPEELYTRWTPFGMLVSHSRCHGEPPREPWEYSPEFMDDFRRAVELKYRLMPYIYAQAAICSRDGFPMIRTLFFEYPGDPTSWFIEDEYMFGSDILVAPLMDENTSGRRLYLPPGSWVDYQTGRTYEGEKWYEIEAGEVPAIILVRDGAVIPHVKLAQSTEWIDWKNIELAVFRVKAVEMTGHICFPDEQAIRCIRVTEENGEYTLKDAFLSQHVNCAIKVIKGR